MGTNITDLRFSIYINNDKAVEPLRKLDEETRKLQNSLDDLIKKGKDETAEYKDKKKVLEDLTAEKKKNVIENEKLSKEIKKLAIEGKTGTDRFKDLEQQYQQVRNKGISLGNTLNNLQKELQELDNNGKKNTVEFKELSAAIAKNKAEMDKLKSSAGLAAMSMNDLRRLSSSLRADLGKAIPGSENYKKLQTELNKVNARMAELRGNAQTTGLSLGKMADGFNRYMGMFAAATASLTGVVLGIKAAKKASDEYEQSLQNLSALTGLEGMDLSWLGEQAKKMGTETQEGGIKITKGATDILRAYTLMGSAKPELLKDKEALNEVTKQALILAEAAQMETEPAVTALASIMNQFGAGADQAGKYINVLAAGAKEGAAEIPDLGDSIIKFGAAAGAANIPVEQSVALVEALSEKGIKGEIAGTGLKTMLIKLMSGADDTNPKIVGLNTALDNLAAKNMSAAEMTKLFGLESYTVAQNIINQKDRVGELTTAVTGTNTAYEQAAKTTSSAKAAMEQAKNRLNLMAIELGEKLTPALTLATGWTTKFIQAFITIINFAKENKGVLITLTTTVIAYAAATKISAIWTNRHNAESLISITITKAKSIATAAETILTKAYAVAQLLLHGNVKAATIALKEMTIAMRLNPIGALVGVVTLAVGAFLLLKNRMSDTAKSAAEFYSDLYKERNELDSLFEAVKKTAAGTKARKDGIEQINKVYGQYLPQLLTEKSSLNDINKAQLAANTALRESIALKSKEKQMGEIMEKSIEKQRSATESIFNSIEKTKGSSVAGVITEQIKDLAKEVTKWNDIDLFTPKIKEFAKANKTNFPDLLHDFKNIVKANLKEIEDTTKLNSFYDGFLDKGKKELDNETKIAHLKTLLRQRLSKEERADITKELKELTKIKKDAAAKEGADPELNGEAGVDKAENANKQKIDLEKEYQQMRIDLMEEGFDKEKAQEELKHNENLIRFKTDKRMLEVEELRHQNAIEDIKLKYRDITTLSYTDEEVSDTGLDNLIKENKFQKGREELKKAADEEKDKVDLDVKLGKLSPADANQEKLNIELAYLGSLYAMRKKAGQDTVDIERDINDKIQDIDKETYNKKKAITLEDAAFNAIQAAENAKSFEEAGKMVLNSIRQSIKAYLAQAMAGMIAKEFATKGIFGAITAAAGAALVNVAFETLVPSFASGNVDVIGSSDGRRYNARRGGRASGVSLVKSPTMMQSENGANFLMGEQMPELIIDGPRTRNMMLNYPEIFNAIRSIPQFAAGNVSTKEIRTESKMFTDERLINALDILVNKLDGVDLLTLSNKLGKVDTNKKNINDKFNTTVE